MMDTDRFLAERLMGWEFQQNAPKRFFCLSVGNDQGWWRKDKNDPQDWTCEKCSWDWHPTTSITQALGDGGPGTVVGAMREKGWAYRIWQYAPGKHACAFYEDMGAYPKTFRVIADTPKEAISKAAERALKGE